MQLEVAELGSALLDLIVVDDRSPADIHTFDGDGWGRTRRLVGRLLIGPVFDSKFLDCRVNPAT